MPEFYIGAMDLSHIETHNSNNNLIIRTTSLESRRLWIFLANAHVSHMPIGIYYKKQFVRVYCNSLRYRSAILWRVEFHIGMFLICQIKEQ